MHLSKNNNKLKKNINHSVCRWCYDDIPFEKFCEEVVFLGIKGVDLLKPKEWAIAKQYGLACAMATDSFITIEKGFNDLSNHTYLQSNYFDLIDKAAEAGVTNVICFSGNRNGLDDNTALENCIFGLLPVVKYAEEKNIVLFMELLNSKVDHPDYQCDRTAWGVALAEKLGSPNFKLLYDIYHMQIMEGDIIATINKYHQFIGHYHTGGVPGRNEINETQELNYPAILKAILQTGFHGFVAQEFIPTNTNKILNLKEAIAICDV